MNADIITTLDAFFEKYPTQTFPKGKVIFHPQEEPSGIYYIQSGIVRRYWIFANGQEITLNLYKPHTFLPMSWAIAHVPNAHFYEAMTNVVAKKAPKKDVLAFLHTKPDIVYDLLQRVYIGMEGLWTHLEYMTSSNSYLKLVASLVILAKRFRDTNSNTITIDLPLSESSIAHYAGMARETVNRELQKLKKENLVSFEKKVVVIHDLKKLEELIQEKA